MHGRLRYYADTLNRIPDDAWIVVTDVDVAVLRPLRELLPFAEGPKAFTTMCNGGCKDPALIDKSRCGNPANMGFAVFRNSAAHRDLYETIARNPNWNDQRVLNGLLCPMYNNSNATLAPKFFKGNLAAFGGRPHINNGTVVYHAMGVQKDVAGKLGHMRSAAAKSAQAIAASAAGRRAR